MLNTIVQRESSECGLACLAMVANAHGCQLELRELRQRFHGSQHGANLPTLIEQAGSLGLLSRPVRAELAQLSQLQLPCILHWDMNHFVVLAKINKGRGSVTIYDPAIGKRSLSLDEVSAHFTGVALEMMPSPDFRRQPRKPRLKLSSLTGRLHGLKRSLAEVFATAVALQLFVLLAPLLTQVLIDDVLISGDQDLLHVLVLGFGIALLVQTAIGYSRSWMILMLGQRLSAQWAGNIFSHLLKLPTAFFEKRSLGDISSRFQSVGTIQRTLTTSVIESMLDGFMALAALIMMLVYSGTLTAVVAAAVALYGAARYISYRQLQDASSERLILAAKENSYFLETIRAILPIKLFNHEENRRARWQNLLVEVQNRDVRTGRVEISMAATNSLIFGFENLLVIWIGARMILNSQAEAGLSQQMTTGMLIAFLSYKSMFTTRIATLVDNLVQIRMLNLHFERLSDIALEVPETDGPGSRRAAGMEASIEMRGVSFRYGDGEPWVLKGANLTIQPGECVALTGASGTGKSTLLKILLGILTPSEGQVLYGGQDIRQLSIADVRSMIGTVMQDDLLLAGSIKDNVSFFQTQPDSQRVIECLKAAQIYDEVMQMPMGVETLMSETGSGLSGGQRQRILLARAMYKQPIILAMDEATSHLDLSNERQVAAELAKLNVTRLIIAHREETIAGAQRVVELSQGVITDVTSIRKKPLAPSHSAEQRVLEQFHHGPQRQGLVDQP